jgi:UDP-N-acetylglucosamine 2-epimerase
MTLRPDDVAQSHPAAEPIDYAKTAILEDLFYLGYTLSDKIVVYKTDTSEITAKFRTITPIELRSIFEVSSKFTSFEAQDITNKIEVLARAITHINDMPLILNTKDREDFFQKFKREPTPLDQARYVLTEKISSIHMLNLLYEAYANFADSIRTEFEDIKKKLKSTPASK